jgi:hypothetical protein
MFGGAVLGANVSSTPWTTESTLARARRVPTSVTFRVELRGASMRQSVNWYHHCDTAYTAHLILEVVNSLSRQYGSSSATTTRRAQAQQQHVAGLGELTDGGRLHLLATAARSRCARGSALPIRHMHQTSRTSKTISLRLPHLHATARVQVSAIHTSRSLL